MDALCSTIVTNNKGETNDKDKKSTPNSASARRELVENEIYEHASRLFAERGFAGTNLQDIATSMGITRPALYYYVKSKDDLLARLVTEITQGSAEETEGLASDRSLDPPDKLYRIAHAIALARAQQPARFLLLERSEAELPPELDKIHIAAKRATLAHLTRVIDEGIRGGQFRPVNPRTAALSVMGMCNWVAWWYKSSDTHPPSEVADDLGRYAVAMVGHPADRAPGLSGPDAAIAMLRADLQYLEHVMRDRPRE